MSVYTEDTKRAYTLLQKVHELEKELDAIHKEIDEKIGKIDLSALATKTELNGLETDVTNLQGQVTAVDSRVDSVGQEISSQVTNLENLSAVTPTEIKSVVGADHIERLYLTHDGEVLSGQDGLDNRIVTNSDFLEYKNAITTYLYKAQNINLDAEGGDYYFGFYPVNPDNPNGSYCFKTAIRDNSTGNLITNDLNFVQATAATYHGLPYFGGSDLLDLSVYNTNGKSGILGWNLDKRDSTYWVVSGTGIPVFNHTDFTFSTIDTLVSNYFGSVSSNSTANRIVDNYFIRGDTAEELIGALSNTGKLDPHMATILFYDGYTGGWSCTSVDPEQQGKDQMLVYNATTHGLEFRPIQ